MAANKLPFKKLEKEKQEYEEARKKKKQVQIQRKLGIYISYVGYTKLEDFDKKHEKALFAITTRGVVKLFNSIYEFRKKLRDEKELEDVKKEKKSRNFLTMHNLDPDVGKPQVVGKRTIKSSTKSYQEDNE